MTEPDQCTLHLSPEPISKTIFLLSFLELSCPLDYLRFEENKVKLISLDMIILFIRMKVGKIGWKEREGGKYTVGPDHLNISLTD